MYSTEYDLFIIVKTILSNILFLLYVLLDILDRFSIEQPFSQSLSILHSTLHVLAVQNDYYESSSFDLDTTCQAWASCAGYSCLYTFIEVGFFLEQLMSILPFDHFRAYLFLLFIYLLLFIEPILNHLVHHFFILIVVLVIHILHWFLFDQLFALSVLGLFELFFIGLSLYFYLVDFAGDYLAKLFLAHGILGQNCKIK